MNGYQQEGFGWKDMTIHKGVRWNTANAYLRPALRRKNLQADTRTMITRVVFEKNRAVGVEYFVGKRVRRAMARKGVILSSGAINTPQILNLSGIGNADDLKKLGIPVNVHLPGVGQNFQDHLEMYFHQVSSRLCKKSIASVGSIVLDTRFIHIHSVASSIQFTVFCFSGMYSTLKFVPLT